jgi:hypothetical protein
MTANRSLIKEWSKVKVQLSEMATSADKNAACKSGKQRRGASVSVSMSTRRVLELAKSGYLLNYFRIVTIQILG